MKVEHTKPQNHEETTIRIEGLERGVKLMHITDSHFVAWDERDPEAREDADKYQALFQARTPGGVDPLQIFEQALERGKEAGAECTVLTGDIIHFPSLAGVEAIEERVQALDAPYLYTLGNHDWYFPHLEWNEKTREDFYPRFHRLTEGNPACQAVELGGLRLVALDNSNYQVSQGQVDFLRAQLQSGQPCLLFIHIPIHTPALLPAVMERWEAPIMMGAEEEWTEETRIKWRVKENHESTRACHALLTGGEFDNLAGIFCGHVHFPHAGEFAPDRFQYVTRQGFEGGYRMVEVGPYE